MVCRKFFDILVMDFVYLSPKICLTPTSPLEMVGKIGFYFQGWNCQNQKELNWLHALKKMNTATGILHWEQVLPAAGRWQCSTWLLLLKLIMVNSLCKGFISSTFMGVAASYFASRIFCYHNRMNSEVKLMC